MRKQVEHGQERIRQLGVVERIVICDSETKQVVSESSVERVARAKREL